MNIRELASDFSVYIFSQDADLGSRIKFSLSSVHYETHFFSDFDEMMVRIESTPPHLVVLDQHALVIDLSAAFQKILSVSTEIRLICLVEASAIAQMQAFASYNMVNSFDRQSSGVSQQVQMAVDLACETLFRLYQNEQIYNRYKTLFVDHQQLQTQLQEQLKGPKVRPFQLRIAEYRSAETKEELIQLFFKQTPEQSWAFLKYAPSIQTYISILSQSMPDSWVEGLSYKIPQAIKDFNQQLVVGHYPAAFIEYICAKWGVQNVKIMPLILKNDIEGLFITPQDISAEVAEDFSLMSLVYRLISLELQPKHLDVEDTLTGFYNGHFYKRILDKEIDRSKRSFAPISVIKIAVDIFREMEVSQGRAFCDEVLKKVAHVIKDTSRLPDYMCRTDDNEFSIVLTNCNRKGAALRAERLRQKLKAESFSKAGLVVTVSQGISEYPTLTDSAQALNDSARKALDFIASKGGDKICIYKAPQGHKPDFQVNT